MGPAAAEVTPGAGASSKEISIAPRLGENGWTDGQFFEEKVMVTRQGWQVSPVLHSAGGKQVLVYGTFLLKSPSSPLPLLLELMNPNSEEQARAQTWKRPKNCCHSSHPLGVPSPHGYTQP